MAWNMANADLLPATLTFLDLAEGSSASPDVARPARAPVRPRVDDCCLLKYSTGGAAARRAEERRLPRVGGSLDILRDSFEYESLVAIELRCVNDGVHVCLNACVRWFAQSTPLNCEVQTSIRTRHV